MKVCRVKVGIGQKSRRFLPEDASKPCVVAGIIFEDAPGFAADCDGDVVFHSICNAITSVTGEDILSEIAVELCYKNGITDSQVYVEKALETLGNRRIEHIALSLEGKRPKMNGSSLIMREKIAEILKISVSQVGLTITSGTGFTGFGCGEGVQCYCVITTCEE